MSIRFFKHTRLLHKWIGFISAAFVLVLSVSGVLLMHHEKLGLDKVLIDGKYLPKKYFMVSAPDQPVQSIVQSPADEKTVYVGTGRGLFRSRDAGGHWAELKDGLFNQNIRALAIPPGRPGTIYAGTAKGIFKSEDAGDHWTDWFEESSGLANPEINDLTVSSEFPGLLFAATPSGLFVSRDGGETWETSFAGNGDGSRDVRTARFSSAAPGVLYIGTGNGLYRSDDGGKSWEKKWSGVGEDVLQLVSLNTEPEFFYLGTGHGLYKSFTQGTAWTQDREIGGEPVRSIFVDPENSARIYAAAGGRLLYSKDGGDRWEGISIDPGKNVSSDAALPASLSITRILRSAPPSPALIAGTTAGLMISRDEGRHWNHIDLSSTSSAAADAPRRMDLLKLITEIHTGRYFGSYFYLAVDLATAGLVALVFSGVVIGAYRAQMARRKKALVEKELGVDMIIDIQETADDLSQESRQIHDMVEHINQHLAKCKSIYMRKEKKEIEEIGRHIHTLDKKMHHIIERIGEFEKISQN
ncbi:MAG: PepSY domain-containing protein [Nitrospinae bacterium]|nr:PepSY domain-containing protein [Nitrospinota bacterium]